MRKILITCALCVLSSMSYATNVDTALNDDNAIAALSKLPLEMRFIIRNKQTAEKNQQQLIRMLEKIHADDLSVTVVKTHTPDGEPYESLYVQSRRLPSKGTIGHYQKQLEQVGGFSPWILGRIK